MDGDGHGRAGHCAGGEEIRGEVVPDVKTGNALRSPHENAAGLDLVEISRGER
jgi:hypothetical protein